MKAITIVNRSKNIDHLQLFFKMW